MKTEAMQRLRTTMEMCELVLRNVFSSLRRLHKFIPILLLRPSLLRKTSKEDLQNFDLQKLCEEWQERAPTFYALLLNTASRTNRKGTWSILLKQRNREMNATAVMGILLKSKVAEVILILYTVFTRQKWVRSWSEVESEGKMIYF